MIVGLTGGIGCGKSTATQLFTKLGWLPLSADTICHEIYAARDAVLYAALAKRWGGKIFQSNGRINNRTIADIVFSDQVELNWLNQQLHPLIKARADKFIGENRHKHIMFEIPLLFEAGWDSFTDTTITVWAEQKIVFKRLAARGLPTEVATARMNCQADPDDKLAKADFGLINNGSIDNLFKQCKIINKKLNIK
jgi:dephospho-CoA kinase